MLILQMVSTCNFWLNVYPPSDGVSHNINPRELITGMKIDYKNIFALNLANMSKFMKNMTIQ
jgi:hypothetical protein